jgi:hypothetical protein
MRGGTRLYLRPKEGFGLFKNYTFALFGQIEGGIVLPRMRKRKKISTS